MIDCSQVISFFEQLAPQELTQSWDNTGLLVGSRQGAVNRILVCLDVTNASVNEAIAKKADLIVTHHPVIFKELKRLNEDDMKGKLLYSLIKNDISVYSAHTNLDYAISGVNTQLALALGINDAEVMGEGPGKCGVLKQEVKLDDFLLCVKQSLNAPFLKVIGHVDSLVRKVAVFSGSFDDDLETVIESGADVLVTGDLKYHTALDALENGLCIVDAGHFSTERVVLPFIRDKLAESFKDVEVLLFEEEKDPFRLV
jgi:dinuclear metal center YbgI/SA1388 family protein